MLNSVFNTKPPPHLKRYWFDFKNLESNSMPIGTQHGCGISAYSYADAINLINEIVFEDTCIPHIAYIIEDIDVSTLDNNHVLNNMGDVTKRGVWFPLGYEIKS